MKISGVTSDQGRACIGLCYEYSACIHQMNVRTAALTITPWAHVHARSTQPALNAPNDHADFIARFQLYFGQRNFFKSIFLPGETHIHVGVSPAHKFVIDKPGKMKHKFFSFILIILFKLSSVCEKNYGQIFLANCARVCASALGFYWHSGFRVRGCCALYLFAG